MYSEWTRIDNLPFFLYDSQFAYIGEDAECLGDVGEWEVENYVRDVIEKDFPLFFKELRYEDVIYMEYNLFEVESYDDTSFPGYAVYIHFHRTLVELLHEHLIEKHPEYLLQVI